MFLIKTYDRDNDYVHTNGLKCGEKIGLNPVVNGKLQG